MNTYEITLLIRPDVNIDDCRNLFQTIKSFSNDHNIKFSYSEYWGLRNLEYLIKKNQSAHFFYLQYSADNEASKFLNEKLKINDLIIRYLIVKIEKEEIGASSPNSKDQKTDQEDGVIFDDKFKSILINAFSA